MDIEIGEEMIRLGQLLKYANVVDGGGQAKGLLADGAVRVDGEVETRRGRQLGRGAVVEITLPQGTATLRLVSED